MTQATALLDDVAVVPVVDIRDAATAVQLAEALAAGGCRAIEITLRTDAAVEAIRRVVEADTGLLVGAGTVLTAEEARRVADAGAAFTVAPGFDPEVADASAAAGLPHVPGVATATEVQRCLRAGLHLLKIFPAAHVGGPKAVASLLAPFVPRGVTAMPTGGVTAENAADYLALPVVTCVGGTWLTPSALVDAGDWASISERARAAFEALP